MIWLGYVWASWPQCSVMGTDTESKFIGDSNRSQFGELSKSALQIWLPSDSWQTTDWLLTYSWLTPDWLPTDFGQAYIKQQIFFGDDTRSQFGELSKSALQIWRAFQMNSPNLVNIKQLTVCWLTDWLLNSWLTPEWLLTDSWLTLDWLPTGFGQACFLFVFNWAGLKPRRSPNEGVRPRPFSC